MVKFTILLKRKASLSHDEFVAYHKMHHAPLFMSIAVVRATVRRYVQQHAMPVELPGLPPVKYDGITELWFDDVDALVGCFSDADYMAKIRPDEAKFLDLHGCDFIVSAETVIAE
ncbi:EthD domain-containing protein [Rhodopila sp.]|uniref:EthD domain-containing protein n=1 Tax=Rhodopila sp. TaxID=2480087 RepID=UPI003D142198